MEFINLTCEELCDLMCGKPEEDYDEEDFDLEKDIERMRLNDRRTE